MTGRRLATAVTAASFVVVAIAACTTGGSSADRVRIAGLASTERAFAAAAAVSGVRTAFLAALGDDATLFRPNPVNGRAYFSEHSEVSYALAWQPQRVAVAASDDLGFSSGPYRLTLAARSDDPKFGQFFSVWRRDADGRWVLIFDHGSANPGPEGWTEPLDPLIGDGSAARGPVVVAETRFDEWSTRDGVGAAYRAFGSARMRLLRDGVAPVEGADAIVALPEAAARWEWTTIDQGASRASDLAWTFGHYRSPGDDSTTGYYVRFWRAERGEWKILGDVLAPSDDAR